MAASATRRDLLYFTFGDKVRCGNGDSDYYYCDSDIIYFIFILYSNTPKIFTRSILYYKKIMLPLVRKKIHFATILLVNTAGNQLLLIFLRESWIHWEFPFRFFRQPLADIERI